MKKVLFTFMSLALVAGVSSCKKDNNNNGNGLTSGYAVLLRTASEPSADYLLTVADLTSGEISATGTGTELLGWSYFRKVANNFLSFDYQNYVGTGYSLNNGAFVPSGSFVFSGMDCLSEDINGKIVGIDGAWGAGVHDVKINIIDGASAAVEHSVLHPLHSIVLNDSTTLNAYPTAAYVQGSKLFIPFYPMNGVDYTTPATDSAYIAIFSYPGLEFETVIKDGRTGNIGAYSAQPCVLTDEAGNHYTISNTALVAGYTQSTKPAGILKINNGETNFDQNYFFNTEAQGYKVLGGVYAGNGKAVVRVVSTATDATAPAWAAYQYPTRGSAPICKIAILDLTGQTIQIVDDVPSHGSQYGSPFLAENGKVYTNVTIGSATDASFQEAWVYQIDAATATAVKGAKINGFELQAIYKF